MAPDPHGTRSQDVCGFTGLEIRPFSGPERPSRNQANYLWKNFEKLGVSKICGPVAPYYAIYSNRIKTFENWPFPEIQSPEKLAEAGFYYTSTQDNTLCFHCGGGLKNWEADDDPWVEHARWFSRCGFVVLQKGRDFIQDVLAKAEGCSGPEAKIDLEAKPEVAGSVDRKEEDRNLACPPIPAEPLRPSESPNLEKKDIELCRICFTQEREIVFLPCGHFVCCSQCAPSLSTCAVCRKPFEAVVRAFLS